MLWAIGVLIAGALLAPLIHRVFRGWTGQVLALLPLGILVYFLQQTPEIGKALEVRHSWIPTLGIQLAFRLDGLSNIFATLISGIGTLVVLYAAGYMKGDPRLGRFYSYLLTYMAAMLGLVLADDLILLFVFWSSPASAPTCSSGSTTRPRSPAAAP